MDLMVIEDSPTDRAVMEARLRRGFPDARIMIVDDLHQLRDSLKSDNCDVVITDYWLGWTDGMSVLQQVRDRWPLARVILLTGNGGEEVVAAAFKLGLFRCLFKPEGFSELVAATKLAYQSKLHEDKRALMESIVTAIPQSLQCVNAAGTVTVVNPVTQRIYGYPEDQIVGHSFEVLIPEEERDDWRRRHAAALKGKPTPGLKATRLRRNGTPLEVFVTLFPIKDAAGKISQVVHMSSPVA